MGELCRATVPRRASRSRSTGPAPGAHAGAPYLTSNSARRSPHCPDNLAREVPECPRREIPGLARPAGRLAFKTTSPSRTACAGACPGRCGGGLELRSRPREEAKNGTAFHAGRPGRRGGHSPRPSPPPPGSTARPTRQPGFHRCGWRQAPASVTEEYSGRDAWRPGGRPHRDARILGVHDHEKVLASGPVVDFCLASHFYCFPVTELRQAAGSVAGSVLPRKMLNVGRRRGGKKAPGSGRGAGDPGMWGDRRSQFSRCGSDCELDRFGRGLPGSWILLFFFFSFAGGSSGTGCGCGVGVRGLANGQWQASRAGPAGACMPGANTCLTWPSSGHA